MSVHKNDLQFHGRPKLAYKACLCTVTAQHIAFLFIEYWALGPETTVKLRNKIQIQVHDKTGVYQRKTVAGRTHAQYIRYTRRMCAHVSEHVCQVSWRDSPIFKTPKLPKAKD